MGHDEKQALTRPVPICLRFAVGAAVLRRPLPQLTRGGIPEIPIAGKIVRRALLKNTEKSGAIVNDWIPLPGLALELHAQYGQRGPGYTRTYRLQQTAG